MKKLIVYIALLILMCISCQAENLKFSEMKRGDKEYSILFGQGQNLRIPESVKDRYNFDTVKIRFAYFTSPKTQASTDIEFYNAQGNIDNSVISITVGYRRYFLIRGDTALAFDGNIGLGQLEKHVRELGTKTNFTEQIGLVLQKSVSEDSALTLECKFTHMSNAGIKLPNIGINTTVIMLGYSLFR